MDKIEWSGRIQALQPRIRLMRSFDERSHSYLPGPKLQPSSEGSADFPGENFF